MPTEEEIEEKFPKELWATCINTYGTYGKTPIKVFSDPEDGEECTFYDKSLDFGDSVKLSHDKTYYEKRKSKWETNDYDKEIDYYFFASKYKKDVADFILGANYAYTCIQICASIVASSLGEPGFPIISFKDFENNKIIMRKKDNKFFKLGAVKAAKQAQKTTIFHMIGHNNE